MTRKPDDVLVYKYTQQLQATNASYSGLKQQIACTDILINLLYELGYEAIIETYDEVIT